ncbi:MAG: hypothetical protein U1D25_02190 [Hydrogenophaga sp.]|uniref:hypothetical protein n=1 Tax=Hydrogenophaga sp. TaxID=1904254 RepID=UPI002ABA97E4|nr:hypothetical protein [Hydrogenophaga sp.]MDZ4186906.1 hypothetical protein [Hydrogenophaga sp.]
MNPTPLVYTYRRCPYAMRARMALLQASVAFAFGTRIQPPGVARAQRRIDALSFFLEASSSGIPATNANTCSTVTCRYASSAIQNALSFSRPAAALDMNRSTTSRQYPTRPWVLSLCTRWTRSIQPAGNTAV